MSLDDDSKKEIIQSFILQAPPHEVKQVIKCVRVLVADDALVDSVLPTACEEYNCEQFIPVDVPGHEHKMIVSDEGKAEGGYCDPKTGEVFAVDHVTLKATPLGTGVERGPREELRRAVEGKIEKYLSEHYQCGTASVFETEEGIVVLINSERSNPGSSWSGRWRSRTVVQPISETAAKVVGSARNHVHYYEEGNIQMENSHDYDKDVSAKSAEYLPGRVAAAIEAAEDEFQAKVDETCSTLGDRSLKMLRRKLPVSKQPFDFASGAHKIAAELAKAGK